MKKVLIIFLTLAFFFSCKKTEYFIVEGFIIYGDGERVYLEHDGLYKTITIDSTDLNTIGRFEFKGERPKYSDFYSLRIKDKKLIFVVDSTEKIIISGDNSRFATNYILIYSPSSDSIQELRKSVVNIQNQITQLPNYTDPAEYAAHLTEIGKAIQEHRTFAQRIILTQPKTFAAYFALFQKINGNYIFNPYSKDDLPYWKAVATAFNAYMPGYERSKNLHAIVSDAIKYFQEEKEEIKYQEALNDITNKAVGYIDIILPDRNNKEQKLSELEGKVVLVNFISYEYKASIEYTFYLRELYEKYHSKGFEIYQVSLDRNRMFWEISTEELPWICVHDTGGSHVYYASIYNVQSVPTTFLMNRSGTILSRDLPSNKMDSEIDRLIKEKI